MPPTGSPLFYYDQVEADFAGLYYSNDDIHVLHKIVVLAETLLSETVLPTNALFSAYNILQKRFRFNPAHDNRYARVLFKIGRIRGIKTLYEKFEEVLYRMGIEIEYDATEDAQAIHNHETEASQYTTIYDNHSSLLPNRTRRNSDSSLQYNRTGSRISPCKRNNSFSFIPRARVEINVTNEITQENHRCKEQCPKSNNLHAYDIIQAQHTRPRLATRPINSHERSNSGSNSFQIYKKTTLNPRGQPIQESFPTSLDYHAASATTAPTSGFEEETASFSTSSLQKSYKHRSETQIDFEASKMYHRKLLLRTKLLIQIWKTRARQLHYRNIDLEITANNQYKKMLLTAALYNWRIEMQDRNKTRDTEIYFKHLFGRASRARDLYLLHAAFSHWFNYTSKQVLRTAQVRKYLLQTRIFNSWCDITAADELKVRCHVLKRHFLIWRRRFLSINCDNDAAIIKYEDDLVRRFYLDWLRATLASRASFWRNERIKHIILLKWISRFENLCQQQCEIVVNRKRKIQIKAFQIWLIKTNSTLEYIQRADEFDCSRLTKDSLLRWSKSVRMIPALRKFQNIVVSRQIKTAFHIWLHRAHEEKKAAVIDRSKILHGGWINWRHKTRAKLVRVQFDYRLIEEILYKWIIHSRLNLGTRLRNENLLRDTINIWTLKCHALRKHHSDQEALAQEILARRNLNCVLLQWYSSMGYLQQSRLIADRFHQPRILIACLRKWKIKMPHHQQLDQWSRDARFYLSATRALRKWKVNTELAKRDKRKNAYGQVKRMNKVNLVRRALHSWLTKVQIINNMQYQAAEMNYYHSVIVGTNIFDRWRCYVKELLNMKMVWQEKALQKYFSFWLDQSKHFMVLEMETLIIFQERQIAQALKKWSLKYLQVRACWNYALDLREKNAKRNFRKIFTFWHQQAKTRSLPKQQPFSDLDLLGEIARNEAWSEIGEESQIHKARGKLDQISMPSTPALIPGYLNTPSKRSERLTAATAKYYTTPKTPLPTLFERELRAMWFEGPISTIRKKRMNQNKIDQKNFKNDLEDHLRKGTNSKIP